MPSPSLSLPFPNTNNKFQTKSQPKQSIKQSPIHLKWTPPVSPHGLDLAGNITINIRCILLRQSHLGILTTPGIQFLARLLPMVSYIRPDTQGAHGHSGDHRTRTRSLMLGRMVSYDNEDLYAGMVERMEEIKSVLAEQTGAGG